MRPRRAGFTLIELLVVIAIIAILAAILFPVFMTAKERGRQAKCLNNLKQLMVGIRQYCDDNNGIMPLCIQSGGLPDWAGCYVCGQISDVRNGGLWNYIRDRNTYVCPSDIYSKKGLQNFPLSYSMNYEMGTWLNQPASSFWHALKLDPESAGRTARVLILIHEGRDRINDGFFAWGNNWDIPSDVHWNGTTAVYADGHAKWANQKTLLGEMNSGQWKCNSLYP